MQCLFCGKELALLKRLRGSAEFCSEAHRKEYQEQYEQLAVARLLQARPPAATAGPLELPSALLQAEATELQEASPESYFEVPAELEAVLEAVEETQPEEPDPAPLAGFMEGIVVPATTSLQQAGAMDLEPESSLEVSLPSAAAAGASGSQGLLVPAPRVEFELSLQALDHSTRRHDRGAEQREFAGSAPFLEMHLRPGTRSEPAGASEVMEILMSPHPPRKATPWLDAARGFPAAPAELGELSRLDFGTVGFAYSDRDTAVNVPAQETAVLTEEPVETVTPVEAVQAEAVQIEAPPVEPAPPELVTKTLPVTLHGVAAARGNFAETFTSAVLPRSGVQIPPSSVLPLRPAIVFGPAPAPAKAPAAPSPVATPVAAPAPAAAPAQPKPVPSKPAAPKPVQEKVEARGKTSVVPAPKPTPTKRAATAEVATPKVEAAKVTAPPAPVVETPRAAREFQFSSTPAAESGTSIPSLHMEATESAWSKLSQGVKIGVAAAVIVALAGIAYLVTSGGSGKTASPAPVAAAPAAAVASGVPISGGWIEDWGNGGRSSRRISMLSGSVKLSDYRMEFQAQIENKAIGWVFRGLNARNYYVAKLETVKAGLEPTVALVHFAVVDGQDESRVSIPLPMKLRVDTMYKIRFEATGNHFAVWVQDQKIDEWTDSRLGAGGVGLFSERGERAAIQGNVNVVSLVPRN